MDEIGMINHENIFWFHDEENVVISSQNSSVDVTSSIDEEEEEEEEEEENGESNNGEERKAFWELQDELLQTTLYRSTSFEAKVRRAAKDALTKMNAGGCSCRLTAARSCRRCRPREMSVLLQKDGFNSVVCVSKWNSSSEIPAAGQHTYLEVVESANSNKRETKVIVEINFREQFEMGRSSQEYMKLVAKLPNIFVGKVERLRNLVKIICGASKKCMKERNMYMAPWRKHKYMQAKWQGKPLLQAPPPPFLAADRSKIRPEKRGSMLSFEFFVDTLVHSKVVEVV